MDRHSKAISRATRWARSGGGGFRGGARYAMAVLIWSAAVLWIAALMVVAAEGLVIDAAKSGRTTLTLKHRVSDAERAHRGAIREAEAKLARCQSAYDREVTAAEQHLDARELYLHIEAPTLSCVVKCPPGAGARVRSFAAAVNTAASRAAIEEPQRPQRIREAEQRLAMAQASRGPIEAAQHRAQEITSNPQLLAGIDSARRELKSYRKSKSPQPAVPGSTALGKDKLSS